MNKTSELERNKLRSKLSALIVCLSIFVIVTGEASALFENKQIKQLEEFERPKAKLFELPSKPGEWMNEKDPFEPAVRQRKYPGEGIAVKKHAGADSMNLPPLVINGIIWGTKLHQAIINNQILQVGDSIDGVNITEINSEGITVNYNNKIFYLSSPAVKQFIDSNREGGIDGE